MSDNETPEVTEEPKPTDAVNREHWLELAVNELRPYIKQRGYRVPRVRVSVGWPSSGGLGTAKRTIGQCWDIDAADDGVAQIFISPTIADSITVLGTLVHELGHAALGSKAGHGPRYARFCKAVQLEGKPTQAGVGEAGPLRERLVELRDKIGDYPHAALSGQGRKKQGTRLIKVTCPECGYVIRVTRKWLDTGTPECPCGGHMSEFEPEVEREDEDLVARDYTLEYVTRDGRFAIRYVRKVDPRGKAKAWWHVTDYEAHGGSIDFEFEGERRSLIEFAPEPRLTTLYTRQDVLGFIEAVRNGVHKYPALDAADDEPELDPGADFDDDAYIDDDEDETLDNPEDNEDLDAGIDEYPAPA